MFERTLIQNLTIEMQPEDALSTLGRRGAKLNIPEIIGAVNRIANPKFILRELPCKVEGAKVFVDTVVFESADLAEKLAGKNTVFVYAGTAGTEIADSDFIDNAGIKDLLTGAMFVWSMKALKDHLCKTIGGSTWTVLKPGLLADWPVSANIAICDVLGGVADLGVSLNDAGYMNPINSNAGILFAE